MAEATADQTQVRLHQILYLGCLRDLKLYEGVRPIVCLKLYITVQ